MIGGKIININCLGKDKYGRILGDIFINKKESISILLINQKIFKKYDGKKKPTWTKKELLFVLTSLKQF